jgi:hypothetical protein
VVVGTIGGGANATAGVVVDSSRGTGAAADESETSTHSSGGILDAGLIMGVGASGVATQNEQRLEASARNTRWSSFVGTNGSQGHRRASTRCSSSSQATSRRGRCMNHNNFRGCGGG